MLASKRLVSRLSSSSSQFQVLTQWPAATVNAQSRRKLLVTHQSSRTMASSAAEKKKYEWLVIAPDHPGALSKRMEVRPKHLQNASVLEQDGSLVLGGATLDEQPTPGEGPKINGSALIVVAETKAEVEELVRSDIYAQGVWDLDKLQIHPFVSALRKGL